MVRFGEVVMAYFLIGSVLWAGGAIPWDDAGIGNVIVDVQADDVTTQENTSQDLKQLGGPIQEASTTVSGGGLIAAWNIIVKLVGFLFWPVVVLDGIGAPKRIVVVLGGTMVMAFIVGLIAVVRQGS